jgi:hypothetical protein
MRFIYSLIFFIQFALVLSLDETIDWDALQPLDVGHKSAQRPVSPSMWDEVWHKDNEHNNLQDGHMHHANPTNLSPDIKTNEEIHKSELLKLKKSRSAS